MVEDHRMALMVSILPDASLFFKCTLACRQKLLIPDLFMLLVQISLSIGRKQVDAGACIRINISQVIHFEVLVKMLVLLQESFSLSCYRLPIIYLTTAPSTYSALHVSPSSSIIEQ